MDSNIKPTIPGYYSSREAAAVLGLEDDTVRQYIHRGIIRGQKHTGRWFVTAKEVQRYARNRRSVGRPAKQAPSVANLT